MGTPDEKEKVLYPELSYRLVGILFEVYNTLGYGHKEKYYENAVALELEKLKISYKRQMYISLDYKGQHIGKSFLDFLVDGKIILELKQGLVSSRKNIEQVYAYLKVNKLKLGIIAQFTPQGVKCKRVVNVN